MVYTQYLKKASIYSDGCLQRSLNCLSVKVSRFSNCESDCRCFQWKDPSIDVKSKVPYPPRVESREAAEEGRTRNLLRHRDHSADKLVWLLAGHQPTFRPDHRVALLTSNCILELILYTKLNNVHQKISLLSLLSQPRPYTWTRGLSM